MSVTRDPEFPAEYAQLAEAFNRCADGYSTAACLNASMQMVIMAIGYTAKSSGATWEQTEAYTSRIAECILAGVTENWQRESKPTDVVVKPQ